MKFDTYEALTSWMTQRGNKADLSSALSYLESAVSDEAETLVAMAIRNGLYQRRSEKLALESEQDAKDHYLEEINHYLEEAHVSGLTAMELISYRRRPHAWAVASLIREHIEKGDTA
jgi:hypothetical protein